MALIDAEATFSFNKRLNADGTSDVIDLKAARALGVGPKKLYLWVLCVDSLANSDNDETYKLTLRTNGTLNTAGTQLNTTGRTDVQVINLDRGMLAGQSVYRVLATDELERYVEVDIDIGGTTTDGDVVITITNSEPPNYRTLEAKAV